MINWLIDKTIIVILKKNNFSPFIVYDFGS